MARGGKGTLCSVSFKPNANFEFEMEEKIKKKLAVIAEAVRGRVVENISESTRSVGPSAPGQFPHADTGTLRKSIFWKMVDNWTAVVGSNLNYARYLELGTRKMAPRPFLRPTLYSMKAEIQRILGKDGTAHYQ
jgi:HK97 gp10 family phage protein